MHSERVTQAPTLHSNPEMTANQEAMKTDDRVFLSVVSQNHRLGACVLDLSTMEIFFGDPLRIPLRFRRIIIDGCCNPANAECQIKGEFAEDETFSNLQLLKYEV